MPKPARSRSWRKLMVGKLVHLLIFRPRMEKPYFIGITGGSGSGKTSFINQLKEGFTEDQVCVISQDNYYLPRDQQKTDEKGYQNFDRPKSINKKEFVRDLRRLAKGETVEREEYVFNNELAKPKTLTFRPAKVLIIEGLFVLHFKKVRQMLDLKLFLHAKDNLKVIRRIKRDQIERNYPPEDVLHRYEHHVLPAYEKYVAPYREIADLIINNNSDFNEGLRVVRGFLERMLDVQ
ncbi:MAG: P-loop NTPase fold protein [Bacteroidota bacterium]